MAMCAQVRCAYCDVASTATAVVFVFTNFITSNIYIYALYTPLMIGKLTIDKWHYVFIGTLQAKCNAHNAYMLGGATLADIAC